MRTTGTRDEEVEVTGQQHTAATPTKSKIDNIAKKSEDEEEREIMR